MVVVLGQRHERVPLAEAVDPRCDEGPAEEPRGREDEDHDHGFVFEGVAFYGFLLVHLNFVEWLGGLGRVDPMWSAMQFEAYSETRTHTQRERDERTEACRKHILVPRVLAYRQVILKAECARTVCAGEFMVRV